jgi:hypothetical protein
VDGYEWVLADNLPAKAVVLKLSPKITNEIKSSRREL